MTARSRTRTARTVLGSLGVTGATTTPTVLTTHVTNGLKLAVTSCPVNWVESALNSGVGTCISTPRPSWRPRRSSATSP